MNNIFACLNSLVGREIVKKDKDEDVVGRWKCKTKTTKWLVTKAYPNYVMAERTREDGSIERTCFSSGDLVVMGVLENSCQYGKL